MPDNSPIINQVNRLRAAQERNEGAELERLIRAFAQIHDKALMRAELLAADMAKIEGPISKDKLMRMRRYRELMAETEAELEKYKNFLEVEIGTASRTAIAAGEIDARNLTSTTLKMMGVNARINAINPQVIEQLVGFLEPNGPLWKRISGLPKYTAEQVSQAIIEGVGLGQNPRKIAREITRTMGMGLTDSMRMMRTAQLYGYREANRASYVANQEVVRGWIWYAQLDARTCGSCWAMHGTEHPLDEVLDDHHNGRCSMVPMVPGFPNDVTPGVDQFEQLSAEKQKAVLGKSKWQAWKEGKFTLSDITGIRADEVYGDMRIERSLKDLLENPPKPMLPKPPKEPVFVDAKTIIGANEYAKKELGLPFADYTGTETQIANEWNKALKDNLSRIPELKNIINATGTTQARYHAEVEYYQEWYKNKGISPDLALKYARKYAVRTPPNLYAYSISETKVGLDGIFVNSKYKYEQMVIMIKRDVANGFHPIGTGTVKAINDHEIGHQIDDLLKLKPDPEFRKHWRSYSRDEIKTGLSEYATKNFDEFIAEAWGEYLNNPSPRPIAKKTGDLIMQIYKGRFQK